MDAALSLPAMAIGDRYDRALLETLQSLDRGDLGTLLSLEPILSERPKGDAQR